MPASVSLSNWLLKKKRASKYKRGMRGHNFCAGKVFSGNVEAETTERATERKRTKFRAAKFSTEGAAFPSSGVGRFQDSGVKHTAEKCLQNLQKVVVGSRGRGMRIPL